MGFMDDAKDAAEATGKKVGEWADDTKERIGDKVDEMQADAEVKKAEAQVSKSLDALGNRSAAKVVRRRLERL